jgi:hypothetical protein
MDKIQQYNEYRQSKKIVFFMLLLIGVIILASIITQFVNPLRRSGDRIRNDILKVTPVGMNMDEVRKVIAKENWRMTGGSSERGYTDHRHSPPRQPVGEKYICADIGQISYFIILSCTVRIYWGFDENGKLIDVYVVKYLNI